MAVYTMKGFAYDFGLSIKQNIVPMSLVAEEEYFILLQNSLF